MSKNEDGCPHDCQVCVGLVEKFGTCEYMHQANPSACRCKLYKKKETKNVQTILRTGSEDMTRYRYWRSWLANQDWVKEDAEKTAPNLPKTGDRKITDFDQNRDTTTE